MKQTTTRVKNGTRRRGAMLVVVLLMLTVLLAMVAFSVDVAYMQLSQAELQAASDAAAKAAARELSLTDGDTNAAIAAGKKFALRNDVAGKPLTLLDSDFEFGQAVEENDGKWTFDPGTQPYSTVRVTGDKTSGSASGDVKLFFGPLLGTETFSTKLTSTASHPESEIVLAIDRSHSMAFDETGVYRSYPLGIPAGDADGDGIFPGDDYHDSICSPPHSSQSRWAAVEAAIAQFLSTLDNAILPPKVGVVTWGSYIGPDSPSLSYSLSGITFPAAVRDVPVGRNYAAVNDVIHDRGSKMMLGGTDTAAGIDESVAVLLERSSPAKKTIILMTDGVPTRGRPAIDAAHDANAAGVIIHVVTFLGGDQSAMAEVAAATGGRHVHAANQQDLIAAFEELPKLLPVALID